MNRDNIISIFQFFLCCFYNLFAEQHKFLWVHQSNLYLLFIIVYRLDGNPTLLIILGFFMGLLLDFIDTGIRRSYHSYIDHRFFEAIYH